MSGYVVTEGAPEPLGLTLDPTGANIAVFSEYAEKIELCLFDDLGGETRLSLGARTGLVWHAHVAGVRSGQRYGLRAHGPYAPPAGHRFNPAKLLIDPNAKALEGPVVWDPIQQGGSWDAPCPKDSAPSLAKCLTVEDLPDIDAAERPSVPWADTIIYETHVKGLTARFPGLDPAIAGTVEALAAPEVLAHIKSLGITTLELMPLHAFTSEPHLAAKGLVNYWGYNSVSFFAPEPSYLGPSGIKGLRETVKRLHNAGLEVLLDVVYNHTGESDGNGPTLGFRGLDNSTYYKRAPEREDGYANDTGCGNTVDLSHPQVLRLVMDSLRWWALKIGVDGFRFDLAPCLVRGPGGFEPGSAFLDAIAQDPVLRELKLVAEPWDIGPGGYRLGAFPAPWAEWNDRFRDAARACWLGHPGAPGELADGLLGSPRVFDHQGRRTWSSVNFIACHDGFTLSDLTQYAERHNEANGEGNRDGHGHNLSQNFGVEGPTDDPSITRQRRARAQALIATALLAQGIPMLRAGDELGQSQRGNNNAYCQDNETTWIDWAGADTDMLAFCRKVIALRRDTPCLRSSVFLHGAPREADGLPDVEWLALSGSSPNWDSAHKEGFAVLIRGRDCDKWALIAFNPGAKPQPLQLSKIPRRTWTKALETAPGEGQLAPGSLAVWLSVPEETS